VGLTVLGPSGRLNVVCYSLKSAYGEELIQHENNILELGGTWKGLWCDAGRMMNVGVSGSVRLEWTDKPVRPERFVPPATLSEDLCGGAGGGPMVCRGVA